MIVRVLESETEEAAGTTELGIEPVAGRNLSAVPAAIDARPEDLVVGIPAGLSDSEPPVGADAWGQGGFPAEITSGRVRATGPAFPFGSSSPMAGVTIAWAVSGMHEPVSSALGRTESSKVKESAEGDAVTGTASAIVATPTADVEDTAAEHSVSGLVVRSSDGTGDSVF